MWWCANKEESQRNYEKTGEEKGLFREQRELQLRPTVSIKAKEAKREM
jgi:hypothetical protein